MARCGLLAMAAALATASEASEIDCSPAGIQTTLSGACPVHMQHCNSACRRSITTMHSSCPHFKHALYADDLGFITKTCGISLNGGAHKASDGMFSLTVV